MKSNNKEVIKKMYAKLENGFLRSAPKTITLDGKTINNPLPEELEELGYKPVVYTDMPDNTEEGKHWESSWTEEETEIKQVWTFVDDYDLEQIRTLKKNEISDACEQTIYNGIDVEMSTGTQHFSLTEKDQINIFGLKETIDSGETRIEYHSDGNPCIYYSVEDIQKLIAAAMGFVKYNTTYCNSLNVWISKETNAQTISEMYYGMDIPEEHQSEVLKNYIRIKAKDL